MNDLIVGAVFLTPAVSAVGMLWAVVAARRTPVSR